MAKNKETGDYYDSLRARFAGKEDGPAPKLRVSAPLDTTDRLFGATPVDETREPRARFFDPEGVRTLGDELGGRIRAHGRSAQSMLAHTIRLLIGGVWLGLAAWYLASPQSADNFALGQLFTLLAGVGVGAAVLGAVLSVIAGRIGARRTENDALALGQRVALETRALSDQRGPLRDPVSADVFLKSVAFANAGDDSDAQFSAFVKREHAAKGPNVGAAFFVIALVIAGLTGASLALSPAMPLIGANPLAATAISVGLFIYAGAGLIAALTGARFRTAREADMEAGAHRAALSGFAAARGEAPGTLAKALVGDGTATTTGIGREHGAETPVNTAPNPSAPRPANPSQRADDSRPLFVETGFQASPTPFEAGPRTKKFRP